MRVGREQVGAGRVVKEEQVPGTLVETKVPAGVQVADVPQVEDGDVRPRVVARNDLVGDLDPVVHVRITLIEIRRRKVPFQRILSAAMDRPVVAGFDDVLILQRMQLWRRIPEKEILG